jgi:hypothetical protein
MSINIHKLKCYPVPSIDISNRLCKKCKTNPVMGQMASFCNRCLAEHNFRDKVRTKDYRELKKVIKVCSRCGSIENVEIHHLSYDLSSKNIIFLCKVCHRKEHEHREKYDNFSRVTTKNNSSRQRRGKYIRANVYIPITL